MTPASGVLLGRGPRLTGPRRLGGSNRVLQVLRVFHSGGPLRSSTRYPGAPLPLCSYVTRGLVIVDRTFCACLVTCSSRHLTPHLSDVYIRTTHSFRPQGIAFISFLCVLGRYRLRAWGSKNNERVILLAIRIC